MIPDNETLACPWCGRTFTRTNHRQKFCSTECKRRAQNKRWYERHKEEERARLNESNKRRRARQHNEATKDRRKSSISLKIRPPAAAAKPPADDVEAALQKIMSRLNLTRGQAIARAIKALAATLE